MLTDSLPKKALLRAAYLKSDQLCSLEVPADDRLRTPARSIEEALNAEQAEPVRKACLEFLTAAADFYGVSKPQVRVLAARPLRVRENRWATELFGDYHLEKKLIRVWMRALSLNGQASVCPRAANGRRQRAAKMAISSPGAMTRTRRVPT
jgi:hypothetical protein